MLEGKCLCKSISYRANQPERTIVHCHCKYCQKNHTAAFSTNIVVSEKNFDITHGKELLSYYESSPGKFRAFCSVCGSSLFHKKDSIPDKVTIKAGSIDSFLNFDKNKFKFYHINCESDQPWMHYENQHKYKLFKD